jgi:hypothetical protein
VEAFAGGGLKIIDDDVKGLLEWAAGFEDEGPERVVALEVDTVDVFDGAGRIDLDVDGRDGFNVWKLAKYIGDTDVRGGGASGDERIGCAGTDDHIPANTCLLVTAGVEHAKHDGGDRKDHDHLDRDSEGADDGAQRTMDEIAKDELVHDRS